MKYILLILILTTSVDLISFAQQSSSSNSSTRPETPAFNKIRDEIFNLDNQISDQKNKIIKLRLAIDKQNGTVNEVQKITASIEEDIKKTNDYILWARNELDKDVSNDPRLQQGGNNSRVNPKYDKKYAEERFNTYTAQINSGYDVKSKLERKFTENYTKYVVPELTKLDNLKTQLGKIIFTLNDLTARRSVEWFKAYKNYRPAYIQTVHLTLPSKPSILSYELYSSQLKFTPEDYDKKVNEYMEVLGRMDDQIEELRKKIQRASAVLQLAQTHWDNLNKEYIKDIDWDLGWAIGLELVDFAIAIGTAGESLPATLFNEFIWRGVDATSESEFSDFPSLPESFIELRDNLSKLGPGSGQDDKIKELANQIRQKTLWRVFPLTEAEMQAAKVKALASNGMGLFREMIEQPLQNPISDEGWEMAKTATGIGFEKITNKMTDVAMDFFSSGFLEYMKNIDSKMASFLSKEGQENYDRLLRLSGAKLNEGLQSWAKTGKIAGEFGKAFVITAAKAGIKAITASRAEAFYQMAMADLTWFVRRYELYEARVSLQLYEAIQDNFTNALVVYLTNSHPSNIRSEVICESGSRLVILGDDEINQDIVLQAVLSNPVANIKYRVVSDKLENEFSTIQKSGITGQRIFLYLPRKTFTVNDSGMYYLQFTSPDLQETFDPNPKTLAILKNNLEWDGIEKGIDSYPVKIIRAAVHPEFKEVGPGTSFRVSIIAPLSDNKKGRGYIYLRVYSIADTKTPIEKHYVTSSGDGRPILQELLAPGLPGSYLLELYNEDRKQVLATDRFEVKESIVAVTDPPGKFCNQRLTDFFNVGVKWGEFQFGFPRYRIDEGYELKILQKIRLLEKIEKSEVLNSFLKLPYRKFFFETIKKIKELPLAEKLSEYDKIYGSLGSNIIESEISCDHQVSGSYIFYAGQGLGEIYARSMEYIELKQLFSKETKTYFLILLKELKATLEPIRNCLPSMDIRVLDMKTVPDDPNVLLSLLKEKIRIDFTVSNCCCESKLYQPYDDVTLNGNAQKLNSNNMFPIILTNDYWQSSSIYINKPIYFTETTNLSGSFSFEIDNPRGLGNGADGICFVLQAQSVNAGTAGGGIGYEGIKPSIAIEFDTYDNGEIDDNHIGINIDGSMNSVKVITAPGKLDDNNPWYAWVDYNSVTSLLEVRVSRYPSRPSSATLFKAINLHTHFKGKPVFVGFSSGTGAGAGDHMILNWKFDF